MEKNIRRRDVQRSMEAMSFKPASGARSQKKRIWKQTVENPSELQ